MKCLVVLATIGGVFGASMVVHESRPSAPSSFVKNGPAPGSDSITLRIALAANNIVGLQEQLLAVSDPSSSRYGQHLSKAEVELFMSPSTETVSSVNDWLSSEGLKSTTISSAGDWISITLPVSKANSLLAADFEVFTHTDSGQQFVRTLQFSIPSNLVGHIDAVHPTTSFVAPPKEKSVTQIPTPPAIRGRAVPASCANVITPACLQDLYGIPTTPATDKANTLLVTAYVGQFAQEADLRDFLEALRPDINAATTFTLETLDGGTNPQSASKAGVEANLDIQYTIGLATDVPVEFMSVGTSNSDFATSLLDTTTTLLAQTTLPNTMTTSYGENEPDFGESMATKLCNNYMALGARGLSIMFASGDGGVRGNHDTVSQCPDNTFIAVFPTSCPFVTSVGATIGINPEVAVNFTGGGFSNFFTSQSYQTTAVQSFLSRLPSNFVGTFDKTGRGYPDVSFQGVNFEIFDGGEEGLVSGTSCASPSFAASISLINDRLVAAGKSPLGFLNPLLYANPSAFTDITSGKNVGFTCPSTSSGFTATTGWDPLSGLGTPKFASLLQAAGA